MKNKKPFIVSAFVSGLNFVGFISSVSVGDYPMAAVNLFFSVVLGYFAYDYYKHG